MPETSLQTTLPSSHFILPCTNSTSSRLSSSFSLCQWVFLKWVWALNRNYFAWNWIQFPTLLWRVSRNKATWHPWSEGTPLAPSQPRAGKLLELPCNFQLAHQIVSLFHLYFIPHLTLLSHLLFLPTLRTSKCISASKFSLGLFFSMLVYSLSRPFQAFGSTLSFSESSLPPWRLKCCLLPHPHHYLKAYIRNTGPWGTLETQCHLAIATCVYSSSKCHSSVFCNRSIMPATQDLLTETLLISLPLSKYNSWLLAEFISVLKRQASVKCQNIS